MDGWMYERSLAASFVLTTYDENVNQFNIDGMGLERLIGSCGWPDPI